MDTEAIVTGDDHRPWTWSVSQSATWRACRRQWWYRHRAHATPAQPAPARQVSGSALHAGLAAAYTAVRRGGLPTGMSMLDTTYAYAVMASRHHWATYGGQLPAYMRDDDERALGELLRNLPTPPWHTVLAVEAPFTMPLMGMPNPPPLRGVIDLVLATGPRDVHIRDWKRTGIDSTELQLDVYHAAWRHQYPDTQSITVGAYSITNRQETVVTRTSGNVTASLSRLARDYVAMMEATDYPPTPGEQCGTCPFRSYCPLTEQGTFPIMPGVDVAAEKARLNKLVTDGR